MSGPIGAGAGAPPQQIAATTSTTKKYRPPNTKELKDIIKLFHLHAQGFGDVLSLKDADRILVWLKERPDLSVDWFYVEKRDGPVGLHNPRNEFATAHNSIVAMIFTAESIPVNHPLIEELACRNPDFNIEDEDGESLLKIMKEAIEYWDSMGYHIKRERDINYRAKYELVKNPEALKEMCNRKYIRSGVKNVASLQLASKTGLPLPEGPLSIITGMLTGKAGNTSQQMTAAKKNLYIPPPAPSTSRRKGRGRGTGPKGGPKGGGRMTRRRPLHK